ncbi:C2H2 finger domain-containing protein [Histoplasma capsulatum H143]|uniref:C2H2 finger domain-containing protein n=1 Tax=Ajellomyces capsulatus (strain H143) TaxID=544712 RepID=C6H2C6_AJECH|nr:C2H2 finger domain-containing protein [Histoplasma capsulatum H143]
MASFKESLSSTPSRPISHTTPPLRQSNGRHHSHSVSLGAVNINHRVTRRESMTSAAASSAATAAAVAVAMGESPSSAALSTSSSHLHHHRRALNTRKAVESTSMGASSGFASFLARNAAQDATPARKNSPNSIDENTAVEDVSPLAGGTGAGNNSSSSISNGKPITKGNAS